MPEKKKAAKNFESSTDALAGIHVVPAAKRQVETSSRRSQNHAEELPVEPQLGEEKLVTRLIDFIKGL